MDFGVFVVSFACTSEGFNVPRMVETRLLGLQINVSVNPFSRPMPKLLITGKARTSTIRKTGCKMKNANCDNKVESLKIKVFAGGNENSVGHHEGRDTEAEAMKNRSGDPFLMGD
ncbi:hypothetical protein GOBAR_AA28473 [Gossypium barbadense]|uniref:Uncharacterized protein n=1 Tax=Gossypium barbadense TaxID=3634 RepID=A0A2P5WM90_GOSBA|nr:hypothetical protein GOBAR_AA28473 [Gossypium barbadense]